MIPLGFLCGHRCPDGLLAARDFEVSQKASITSTWISGGTVPDTERDKDAVSSHQEVSSWSDMVVPKYIGVAPAPEPSRKAVD